MRLLLTTVTVVLSVACALRANVSSHVDADIDFSTYRTYDWGPADALPTGDPRLDKDPIFHDRLQGSIERQLAGRRNPLIRSADPDLLIHYHASVSRRIEVDRDDWRYSVDAEYATRTFEAGTIVIDVVDRHTNRLIWRGWARSNLDDLIGGPDRSAQTIADAVARMLRELP
jgi:hypothetical protein